MRERRVPGRVRADATFTRWALGIALAGLVQASASAQAPVVERVSFDQAVERALARNPTLAQATAGILRAEAILQQTRSLSLPTLGGFVSTLTIDPVPSFDEDRISPRTQATAGFALGVPLIVPVEWALRNQAADQVGIARQDVAEIRRQIAVSTGRAYLTVIGLKRVVELNALARDTARSHSQYARQRLEGGVGSRLNYLRADQEAVSDETRVEEAQLGVLRAQEALGVLMGAEGPVDTTEEPTFPVPPDATDADALLVRPDVQLVTLRQSAAERVVNDSWRERLPSVSGFFDPQWVQPAGLFNEPRSLSARLLFQVPLFDSGLRSGRKRERQAELDVIRAERESVERQARSEIREARDAVMILERAADSARRAAALAAEVVQITDVSFRAGATTNIEVIDAQRRARDTDTAAVIAEDALRRARLDLLVAVGQFPR